MAFCQYYLRSNRCRLEVLVIPNNDDTIPMNQSQNGNTYSSSDMLFWSLLLLVFL